MKVQNPTKLDIFFKGGGIIKFPVQNLKQIDIEPIDGDGGGSDEESPAELTNFDVVKNYVNLLYDRYNIEFDIVEETSTFEEEVEDEDGNSTDEIITATEKGYKFVPKTSVPRVYLNKNSTGTISQYGPDGLDFSNTILTDMSSNGISKIILDDTELTIQQLIDYDIVQVGTAKLYINVPNYNYDDYAGYLEYLDWIRNNVVEDIEIPILLYGRPKTGTTRQYLNNGVIQSQLFLNGSKGIYSQSVFGVLEEELG